MKVIFQSLVIIFSITTGVLFTSCDKIDNPYPPTLVIDTTLFPGVWSDYLENEYPVFEPIGNQLPNVLLEEYTGHLCNNCPNAAIIAHEIKEGNPERIFVASIHAAPGGMSSFQMYNPNDDKFYTNHTNQDGLAYGQRFASGFNFFGNPQGTVNRKVVDGKMFDFSGTWQTRVNASLNAGNPKIKLQGAVNFYEESNGGFLHLRAEKSGGLSANVNAVIYVMQDTLTDWQLMPNNSYNPNYLHKDKHLGSIDSRPWGRPCFSPEDANGTLTTLDYSFTIPVGVPKESLYFLAYVFDMETYEIFQVIKLKL